MWLSVRRTGAIVDELKYDKGGSCISPRLESAKPIMDLALYAIVSRSLKAAAVDVLTITETLFPRALEHPASRNASLLMYLINNKKLPLDLGTFQLRTKQARTPIYIILKSKTKIPAPGSYRHRSQRNQIQT